MKRIVNCSAIIFYSRGSNCSYITQSIFVFLLVTSLVRAQIPQNDAHWELAWQDSFSTFNSNIWLKVDWAIHGAEPQLYLANNVSVNNGNLILELKNNSVYCPNNPPTVWGACAPCSTGNYNYTSGWVETKQTYSSKFGYLEARIKLPFGNGYFPAFWTFIAPNSNGQNAAEIDIFEMTGGSIPNPNTLTTNYHTQYPSPNVALKSIPIGFDYQDWHTYSVEWSPNKVIWYVDGYPIRVTANTGIIDPVRIILNLAVEPNFFPVIPQSSPAKMLVDFVRYYKLKYECNTTVSACNYDFSSYNNRVKKKITIGNGLCPNIIDAGENVYLRASEEVVINGDFTMSIGSELYIDVNACY
jgi:beta-glucanase (GH16 family)